VTGQKVSIKGTVEEIKKAKELILLKLEEDGHGKFIAEQNRKNRPAQNLMHQTFESSNVETLDWCTKFVKFMSAYRLV